MNSTAICRACGSHPGAMDHIVAPAANRLANVNDVAARSAAKSASNPRSIAVVATSLPINPPFVQRRQHRDRGLTKRQPPIVGRNRVMRQYLESVLLQLLSACAQQQYVLKHPAGEAHQAY